ncbi:MAG: 5-formyltetrahydrofolate cyclo-ligase [Pseudonocardiaceae bacterium]
MDVNQAKQDIRQRMWQLLEREQAVPPGSYGKIPGFYGAEQTAVGLAGLPAWQQARTVKANPDYAQLHVRVRALNDGKLLYMAVPKIADAQPFYLLDPEHLDLPAAIAAEKSGAARSARRIGLNEMRPIDIVVCGSVAVNRLGTRIGKGAGYSDLEVALLIEAGLVTDQTLIVAPVHQLQVVEDEIPETEHDFSVDVIITPDDVIECGSPRRPRGIIWKDLTPQQVEAIPVLKARQKQYYLGARHL